MISAAMFVFLMTVTEAGECKCALC